MEAEGAPPPVRALRARLDAADAVLVCSPEYAHGLPGSFKNALDWLVGVGFERRPVGALDASPLSTHAFPALLDILATMDGVVVPEATATLERFDARLTGEALAVEPAVAPVLRACADALCRAGGAWRAARDAGAGASA